MRYTRLPFGVKSALAIFQRVIDDIIGKIPLVKAYMDDILIGGENREECVRNCRKELARLENFDVKANFSKCQFLVSEIEFLGFRLTSEGIKPTDDKMKAIADAPAPRDLTMLKAYLGLLNFYGNFMKNLSAEIQPLYALTRKNVCFSWTTECEEAFLKRKQLLLNSKVLMIYDPKLPIGIVCDASSYGVGGVLFHIVNNEERPVKFLSSTLSDAEKKYSQLEREALAIIFTLKKCHKYIYGRPFTIFSDHKPLQFIFGEKKFNSVTGARVQRWSLFLSQYNYNIEYSKASRMGNADALSRLPLRSKTNISVNSIHFCSIGGDLPVDWKRIGEETVKDESLKRILEYARTSNWPEKGTN